MGKKLRSMGYPESRKTGGYGDLIVIFNMKEISFIRKYSNFQDASDLKKLGFKIHKNGKVINILNKVSSLNNLITAYNTIKSKPNNINLKINLNPLNNIRKKKLENLSSELLSGRFQFKPLQQIVNSKKKKKILIVPSLIDKLVHQSIKQQLDLLFNPLFKKISYELHSKQRHHTTFNQIKIEFKRINWVFERNIKNCPKNIKFKILYPLIKQHVADNGFESLVRKFYQTEYTINRCQKFYKNTLQNNTLRPIFINIILHELDIYIIKEKTKINLNYYYPSKKKPLYPKLTQQNKKKSIENILINQISNQIYDYTKIQLKYIRHINNFIVGTTGTKEFTENIKFKITKFLKLKLNLHISSNKIKITNINNNQVFFLETLIHKTPSSKLPYIKKNSTPQIIILAPITQLIETLIIKGIGKKTKKGKWKPWQIGRLIHVSDNIIIEYFTIKWQKLWNYYKTCDNASQITKVHYLLKYSCASTLAIKHGKKLQSYRQVFKQYGCNLTINKNKKQN